MKCGGISKFKKVAPPTFHGTTKPLETKIWLEGTEKTLAIIKYLEGDKMAMPPIFCREKSLIIRG